MVFLIIGSADVLSMFVTLLVMMRLFADRRSLDEK